nr:MAG TPA: hypothetical protein [Crassvirales sp.]
MHLEQYKERIKVYKQIHSILKRVMALIKLHNYEVSLEQINKWLALYSDDKTQITLSNHDGYHLHYSVTVGEKVFKKSLKNQSPSIMAAFVIDYFESYFGNKLKVLQYNQGKLKKGYNNPYNRILYLYKKQRELLLGHPNFNLDVVTKEEVVTLLTEYFKEVFDTIVVKTDKTTVFFGLEFSKKLYPVPLMIHSNGVNKDYLLYDLQELYNSLWEDRFNYYIE